jgi:DNA-binding NtrC family response regulator
VRSSNGTTTIVVVDDDADTAGLLRELLERRGYRAVAALSGDRCLEFLRADVAHVVIIDIQMPGMSGIELCRVLRARYPEVVAIVLTGRAELSCAIDAARAGACDTITKPARIAQLELAIGRGLAQAAGRRGATREQVPPQISDTLRREERR